MASRCQCVGVYEAADYGIVVAGLEVVEASLGVVAVATGRRVLRLPVASRYNYESLLSIYHIFAGMTSAACTEQSRRNEAKASLDTREAFRISRGTPTAPRG